MGGPASNDNKWRRSGATTLAEKETNQQAYCGNRGLRHHKRQKIATTLVRLLANLLTTSCAVAQTGKLSAEKQAKIESTISKFMAASKAPGISAAVVQNGEFVWSAGFGMADLENSV